MVLAAGCVGFCRIPATRRRVAANVHFKAHFGWPPDALLQRDDIEARVHAEDRAAFERALQRGAWRWHAARCDRPGGMAVRRDPVHRTARPLRGVRSGVATGTARAAGDELVLVASNVTAEHRMMQQFQAVALRESELRASATANRAQCLDLLSRISHELRSPLNAMLGWNRILAMKRGEDPEIQAITARVAQGGQSAARHRQRTA